MRPGYRYRYPATITPDDDIAEMNCEGVWSITVTVSGVVRFFLRDATTFDYPVSAGSALELGLDMVSISATGTTATGIIGHFQ